MTRVRTVVVALAMVVVGGSVAGGGRAGAAPGPAPAADEDLNNRGVDLRRSGKDREALEVFQQAYGLTHSPRATAQLGLAYQALGRWELAGPLIETALQKPNDPWIKKYVPQLQDAFGVIKQHLAHIELTGDPAGADVVVNGSLAGHLPLPGPLTVSIGTVDLQVRAPGYRDDIRKLTVAAYQYERIFVRLDKNPDLATVVVPPAGGVTTPPPPIVPPIVVDPGAPRTISPRTVVKWSALGLAAAGLGTGIVASVIHQNRVTDFGNADMGNCRQDGDRGVDNTTAKPVPACQSALDGYNTARTWQIIGFSAASAFAATWLVLQLTESSSGSKSVATWSCAPSLASAGGSCAVRF
jgi:hypothetical protein